MRIVEGYHIFDRQVNIMDLNVRYQISQITQIGPQIVPKEGVT